MELPLADADRHRLASAIGEVSGPWTEKPFHPHVTLALVRESCSEFRLRSALEKAFAGGDAIPSSLRLSGVGLFPSRKRPVLFAAVATSSALGRLHQTVLRELSLEGIHPIPNYAEGSWTPHVTLSMGKRMDDCLAWMEALCGTPLFGDYQVDRAELIRFYPKEIASVWASDPRTGIPLDEE
ncbi:MAG: 2'-5' RNA ligase family protein [Verrucomicrobiota bacterium]